MFCGMWDAPQSRSGIAAEAPDSLLVSSAAAGLGSRTLQLSRHQAPYFLDSTLVALSARKEDHTLWWRSQKWLLGARIISSEVLESKPPKPSFLLLLPGARLAAVLRLGPLGLSLPFFFSRCSRSRATNVYGDFAKSQDFKAKGCRSWCFGACGMLGFKLRGVTFLCAGNAWRFWVFGIEEFGLQNAC